MTERLSYCCGICTGVFRIGCYTIYRKICCKPPPPPKPEFAVICIGLTKAGKSTLLALLAGESTEVEPTKGFSIKALQFSDCIINVKEIGGADNVRPYWHHYYHGAQGVIFVLDSSSSDEDLQKVESELSNALVNPQLRNVPCLILATYQDVPGAKTGEQLTDVLELNKNCDGRQWHLQMCSKADTKSVRAGFMQFNQLLLGPSPDREAAGDYNRL
ncbi:ADP-ribosylation factor-like protein 15 [Lineus longissimus]|uniref:ADP-ribosylation factor-like protein 15 n=1 Tax=Lineus longissimus TaxID=88925 RepID=UPI002B4D6F28